ncbi:MAG: beta-ketoacyl-[acyl-carrier-protein] synthase family protein [Chromatiales bacterium]|nr:beta-ketoacyl-[acyl-carrier-protein] synthase family protein [Chromatiales bacterium]
MTCRVVITGMGVISALGKGVDPFWQKLQKGEGGIDALVLEEADALKCRVAAQVNDFQFDADNHFDSSLLPQLDRHSQFALIAAHEAITDAQLSTTALRDSAAIIGTGCGGKETDEQTYCKLYRDNRKRVHPLTIPRGMPSAAASQVSMQLGIAGPVFTVSSACSSTNHAIIQAVQLIQSGMVDCAVSGGTDAPFTYGLLKAWEAMRVLASDTCRPFSVDRSGLVLGEGAGMVVLESLESAQRRGATIHAEIAGVGMSADAGHITDPSPEGATRAMAMALNMSGMAPTDVHYINAHGTGTQANDVSETEAIRTLFGDYADRLLISSTKSMHGHALGAAGGLELIAGVLAMKNSFVPPTINYLGESEGCDLDYVVNQGREAAIDVALSNSFAFGGLNSVLLLKSFPA